MLDFFYFLFVFPLENLLTLVFGALFTLVKNEAIAVVLLATLINLFLFPILIGTEKRAKIETERKKEFDNRISAWKSVYSKSKVFALTRTLYRQNHYHPIFALSALGGLAIQLPFFYAMYFVVTTHRWSLLNGLPLSAHDFMADIDFALGFHLLPVIMTIITLSNVFLSSKEKNARIQGTAIALLFLILLYKMPSILILYWASNMLFSLFKTIVYARKNNEHFTPPPPSFHPVL